MYPTKASQHEFLATCIDVDVEKDVKYNNYATYTIKRGHRTKYFVPYRGMRREICKTQFLHYFGISRFVVESVAKTKAAAAMSNPLSPMKSPSKQAASNTARSSPIKLKFDDMFAHRSESCRKCRKVPKPRKLAGSECPREIWYEASGKRIFLWGSVINFWCMDLP
uniref:Uncharacterized protein n=1 Tax=Eutreptiella gymnastica TaxID=73025 RepID=A0A7S4G2A0_9EUGL